VSNYGDSTHQALGGELRRPGGPLVRGEGAERHHLALRIAHAQIEDVLHRNPGARLIGIRSPVSRPCFLHEARRLMLPEFGGYTGGLERKEALLRLEGILEDG
jgi:hypothetical protein